jgi:hypothetical protein
MATTQPQVAQLTADPHVFLAGRPPMSEFLGFIGSQTIEGQAADKRALADAWRESNRHIRELETAEAGIADAATTSPLPTDLDELAAQVLGDPIVQRSFALTPIEIAVVDLNELVVYQKHINLAYAQQLHTSLKAATTPEEVFRFCLPFDRRYDPPTKWTQVAPNSWIFTSPSNDFRFLEASVLDPDQVHGLPVGGAATWLVALVVGYGSNYLTALRVEGRLILYNGSHRAYALREAGHTQVPCLIQDVTQREELEAIAGPEHPLTQEPDRYLSSARPAMLRDYFDEKLRMIVHVPRKARHVQITFNAGPADLPV